MDTAGSNCGGVRVIKFTTENTENTEKSDFFLCVLRDLCGGKMVFPETSKESKCKNLS